MKISYEFLTGDTVEIEVPDDIGEVSIEIDKDLANSDRRETRRHESYCICNDKQEALVDKSVDVSAEVEKSFECENLHKALEQLLPQQQEIIRRIYFDGESIVAVAKELGITKQACNNRLNKIYTQLKKYI